VVVPLRRNKETTTFFCHIKFCPQNLKTPGFFIRDIAEQALIVTLYCIGANLSRAAIKTVGVKPFIQGICLWIIMASVTLLGARPGFV